MSERQSTRLVKEGRYVAEIEITLIDDDHEWAPFISAQDIRRLDDARLALRRGDLAAAAKLGRVYELMPVEAAE